ncbi:hypothetical protein FRAHR75_320074 [Frankia sp. Hr75.2]|nr:hypothetical protein FRAHR75_320074 [Frankia sp. Hr75.2]
MLINFFANHRLSAVATLVGLIIISAFVIPISMNDGTGIYTGAKLAAAERAVSDSKMHFSGIQSFGHFRVRVEAVEVVPQSDREVCGSAPEAMVSENPENPKHYLVVVSHRTFFGLVDSLTTNYPCLTVSGDVRHSPSARY